MSIFNRMNYKRETLEDRLKRETAERERDFNHIRAIIDRHKIDISNTPIAFEQIRLYYAGSVIKTGDKKEKEEYDRRVKNIFKYLNI